MKNYFSGVAKKPFELTEDEHATIDGALSRYLHMDGSDRATLIDDIELTGGFR